LWEDVNTWHEWVSSWLGKPFSEQKVEAIQETVIGFYKKIHDKYKKGGKGNLVLR
jgi:hypothetical protein